MFRFPHILLLIISLSCFNALADSNSPWGPAKLTETEYKPQKVVYDVHVKTVEAVESVLDRASYLSSITGADPFDQSICYRELQKIRRPYAARSKPGGKRGHKD